MKKLFLLAVILLLLPAIALGFGGSTFTTCSSNSDCKKSGCSDEVCAGINEDIVTACVVSEPPNPDISCQCAQNKCQWAYKNGTLIPNQTVVTPEPKPFSLTGTLKGVYNFLVQANPIFLLVLGVVLIIVSKFAKWVGIILIIFALINLF